MLALAGAAWADAPTAIENSGWELMSIAGRAALPLPVVTAQFAEGKVTGFAGVNGYSTPYELAGNQVHFGDISTTRMAGSQELMEQEAAFLAAMRQVTAYTYDKALLVLTDAAADRLAVFSNVFAAGDTNPDAQAPAVMEPKNEDALGPSVLVVGKTNGKRLVVIITEVYVGDELIGRVPGHRHWTEEDGNFKLLVATPRVTHAELADTRYILHVYTLGRDGTKSPETTIVAYPKQEQ
jgi:heat shock protein HslJ